MSSKLYHYMLISILALILLSIAGGAAGANVLLQKQSQKLQALKVENKVIELQQQALLQARKDVEKYSEAEKIAKSIVPQDKDQAKTVREIVQIAGTSNIPIKSVTFPNSNLGESQKSATPGAAATTPQATATATPTLSQLKPVEGITGVYTLEIKIESAGKVSYQNFLKFLEGLEKNRRTAHVNTINLEPSNDGRLLEFNVTLNAYVKP